MKSIQLFFRKPGASGYESRDFTADGDTWYSFINTVSSVDDIAGGGTIAWYAVATDTKGATTKTAVDAITVTRCDAPASFDNGAYSPKTVYRSRTTSIQIQAYAEDADGVDSVTLTWSIFPAAGGNTPLASGSVAMIKPRGSQAWLATFAPAADWPTGVMVWTVGLVDRYGNQYTSPPFGQIGVL